MLTRTDYTDLRDRGIRPAYIRRKIELWNAWEAEHDAGRARIIACPDWNFEPSDWEGFQSEPGANLRALQWAENEEARCAEVYGVWGFLAQVRMHPSMPWQTVDSLWGIVLDDAPPLGSQVDGPGLECYSLHLKRLEEPSGYEDDLIYAALNELTLIGEGE